MKNQTGSLVSLLSQEKNTSNSFGSISTLFSKKIPEPLEVEEESPLLNEKAPYIDENASALMNKDRTERTIFIGNVDINANKAEVRKFFKQYGEIETLWERSLPLNDESKIPLKAKAKTKDFSKTLSNLTKNCYILFKDKESVPKAIEANNTLFHSRHLRVDSCNKQKNDYETTIFIGNLPYQIDEESLRSHFNSCGEIVSIRLVKDPVSRLGKGFGYMRFKDKEAYKKALLMNNSLYEKRPLRVRKALDPEKLQIKSQKQENTSKNINKRNAERRMKKKEQKNLNSLRNFADTNTLEKNDLEDIEYKNIITQGKSILNKKIRKKKIPQSEKAKYLAVASNNISKRHDKNLFNGVDMLEKRRILRKKKEMLNRKKIALSRKK